jgi:hypothetical protein
MEFNVQAVESIISSSPRKNGSFNLFFKLNEKIGLKLSNNPEQRDVNFSNQEKASKYNLGPEVYGKIDEVNYEGKIYWGYFTEIVWVIPNYCSLGRDKYFLQYAITDSVRELRNKLRDLCDYCFGDSHLGNLGVKNGKLICIDFDDEDYACYVNYDENF